MYKIKQFFKRIYNLYRWLPIIWKDQDWDTHYIWEILKFKLKNQAEYIGNHDRHLSVKRDVKKMMLCVRLIEKIQDGYYQHEPHTYHETKSIFEPIEDKPGMMSWKSEELSEHFQDYFNKYPLIYNQVITANKTPFIRDEKIGIAINIGHINHKRALNLLFKMLKNNIERWWD